MTTLIDHESTVLQERLGYAQRATSCTTAALDKAGVKRAKCTLSIYYAADGVRIREPEDKVHMQKKYFPRPFYTIQAAICAAYEYGATHYVHPNGTEIAIELLAEV